MRQMPFAPASRPVPVVIGCKPDMPQTSPKDEFDPGCVKTLGGITALGILGSTVLRRAKKRKNLSTTSET